ncbi:MAG: hypothetical protein AAFX99_36660, partial [Myxococcota bacterium]
SGQFCDLGSSSQGLEVAQSALTSEECLMQCPAACAADPNPDCQSECETVCQDPSCENLCDFVCFGDPTCTGVCIPDCESNSSGASNGTTPSSNSTTPASNSIAPSSNGTTPSNNNTNAGSGGVCRARPSTDNTSNTTSSNSTSGETSNSTTPIDWTGTWNAQVVYEVSCDVGFGNIDTGNNDYRVTLQISGSNSSLTANIDANYEMTGNGNDTRMTLSGTFPARDDDGDTGSTASNENQISIVIDTVVDNNNATGTIEGQFKGRFSTDCTISSGGTVELTR